MIFYLCNGQELVGTQADARKLDPNYVQIDIPTDKPSLMAFVNEMYSRTGVVEAQVVTPVREPSYTDVSIALEDSWEELPLAMKLHFAGLAMEEARISLKS